jgi:hypothetical protein
VALELEIPIDRAEVNETVEVRMEVVSESGRRYLFRRAAAADDLPSLEDEDFLARLREVAGTRETVVPRADDDDVVRLRPYSSSSILRSLPTQNVLAASQPIIGGASSAAM